MAKVVIVGGGVAGMSAAHELVERGFDVEVYEKQPQYVGGKARSVDVPGTNLQFPDKFLPGEHGFRFFPGFYKHVTDTMKRIPYQNTDGKKNPNGCFDNLTPTTRIMLARYNGNPIQLLANFPRSADDFSLLIYDLLSGMHTGLSKEEIETFVSKIWQCMTSSVARKNEDYEKISWWTFMEADKFSDNYRHLLVEGLTRSLVAAKAEFASMKTGSTITLQLMYNMLDPGVTTDRVLNGPTNEKWLNPWHQYLLEKGVKYFKNCECKKINVLDGKIKSVEVVNENGDIISAQGDYYILATPVGKAAELVSKEITDIHPSLAWLSQLSDYCTAWMNGIQFYLNEDVPISHGHVCYTSTEWAVTSISQKQFWEDYDLSTRYNGKVKGILSVDISDWLSKYKEKSAEECKHDEIKKLVWEQIKSSLNVDGKTILRDEMLEYYYLDSSIHWSDNDNKNKNEEPLLVNFVNSWAFRPQAYTLIPNFFLAADYVQTNTDLATMEGANEAARRAVNSIIRASGEKVPYCKIWELQEPVTFSPLKWWDKTRYNLGLPWSPDVPLWFSAFLKIWFKICFWASVIRWLFGNKKKQVS